MKLKLNLFTKMKKPVCKLPLSLKITLFVLFSFASLLYASNNYAQRTMLNISSQTRTVSEVLTEIEKQTDFSFIINHHALYATTYLLYDGYLFRCGRNGRLFRKNNILIQDFIGRICSGEKLL